MAASIHAQFINRLAELAEQSAKNGEAEQGGSQRVWMMPADGSGDPFDIPGMHNPSFDRSKMNEDYENVHTGTSGKVGEAASLKIQIGCISAMERAYRSRHATSVRCIMHAAARHVGHGHGQGVFNAMQNYAQDLLNAAGS